MDVSNNVVWAHFLAHPCISNLIGSYDKFHVNNVLYIHLLQEVMPADDDWNHAKWVWKQSLMLRVSFIMQKFGLVIGKA